MIDDYQPALVCIVETHVQKEEEIQIPGYSLVYRNDRSANSGGILIGVRDNIKNISLELTQENKVGQSLWILLTNTKKKTKIGVIFAPQENVTSNNELKLMYENIREQIKIGKEEKQQILIIEDFNAKIGEAIGNKTQVTKGRSTEHGTTEHETPVEHRNTGGTPEHWRNKGILAKQLEYHGIVDHGAAEQRNSKTAPRNTTNKERRYIEQIT